MLGLIFKKCLKKIDKALEYQTYSVKIDNILVVRKDNVKDDVIINILDDKFIRKNIKK